ncbi:UDP-glucose/GDP-mannose dehydrogenase family protein [Ammoniphilus sp. YIM 78166]|uniref:UDP-glucose dehydrogenase family protein n=1 Tax=Ammoniphilus sp. YIM 78166 TaxID=1644106 RepID=UPI00106F220D|nr:UDP-glucose/GDP-mannose dehydrogenase family protein [Ammoniphilus sp. YIM 78166]
MKIGIVGLGYVGLVTGIGLASLGHQVIGTDIMESKIQSLQAGVLPIWEEGLEDLFKQAASDGMICFTDRLEEVIISSDIVFLCVGTPSTPTGDADLSQLWAALKDMSAYIQPEQLVVIKSTVPVGTSDHAENYLRHQGGSDLDVVYNPEFLRQGNAVYDFFNPERILVGSVSGKARDKMEDLYQRSNTKLIFCDRRSAELTKYASNAFLAMKISFINMIARLSERVGANVDVVAEGMGADSRIGPAFLRAGVGYGGSCFPKDIQALISLGKQNMQDLPLLESTEWINRQQPILLVEKLIQHLGDLKGKRIALLGLTFKSSTNDIREAPSLAISRLCLDEGAIVHAYDPILHHYPLSGVILHSSLQDTLAGCDAVLLLTEWKGWQEVDWRQTRINMRYPLIVDGRNLFTLDAMKSIAFEQEWIYVSIGRPVVDGRKK